MASSDCTVWNEVAIANEARELGLHTTVRFCAQSRDTTYRLAAGRRSWTVVGTAPAVHWLKGYRAALEAAGLI
jgi:hypothetical protein